MTGEAADLLAVQRTVLDFALRDRGDWDGLRALFAPGASMHISWYSGPAEGFVAASAAMAARGSPPARHLFGVPRIDLRGPRAVAETDVQILVRAPHPLGELDVTSWARFLDLFERGADRWRIARRTAIYDKDRVDFVQPGIIPPPGAWPDLSVYPAELKHLAMLLHAVGAGLAPDTVVAGSAAEQDLRDQARRWLDGGDPH